MKSDTTNEEGGENSDDGEDQYPVEAILYNCRSMAKNMYYYYVKWENYSIYECTWEPESNVQHLADKISEFDGLKKNIPKLPINENGSSKKIEEKFKIEWEPEKVIETRLVPKGVCTEL